MLRCHSCNRRFTVDHGQLTFYSHQDESQWDQLILDSLEKVPETETAAKINVSPYTAFRMRHKFLHACEQLVSSTVLAGEIELDEKYVQVSHKGSKFLDVKPRKRGEPASKRGLSTDQVCLPTGVERLGNAVLLPTNLGNPSSKDLMSLKPYIQPASLVWIDGKTSYNKLLEEMNCDVRIVGDHKTYTSVDHINNVNSFHSMISQTYTFYRGVATKYLNRYCPLFVLMREYSGYDLQEKLLEIKNKLRQISDYFYIRQIKTEDLFSY